MKTTLKDVRICFTQQLFKAASFKPEDDPKYDSTFIMEPGSQSEKMLKKAMLDTAEEKWPGKGSATLKQLVASNRVCLRDGAEKSQHEGFEGNVFVKGSSKKRPTVVDRDRSPLTEQDGRIYPGCYVNAILEVWAQDSKDWGKRINAELVGVQFVKDDAPLGGGAAPATADDFPALEDELAEKNDYWDDFDDDDIPL